MLADGSAVRRESSELKEAGFTIVELLTVVGIMATLMMIAVPVYVSAKGLAQQRTCFQNQNTIARATELYLAVAPSYNRSDLTGVVNSSHPIVVEHIVGSVPRCPSGVKPLDAENPTLAEGAYQFDASGKLMGCTSGILTPHGSFDE